MDMDLSVFGYGFLPVSPTSGFRMDGYFVWCGSAIRGDDGRVYLFAARWPEKTGFPGGYMISSEIVLATADTPSSPFTFERVVLGARDTAYWDGMMTHNPQILKIGNEYVLYYIGTPDGQGATRKIGYAHAPSLTAPFIRSDTPIDLPENANNPAALPLDDGSVLLAFRDGHLRVSIARAERYDAPYTVIASDIFPEAPIEDMFLFRVSGGYGILAEDNRGFYTGTVGGGVLFTSSDARTWRRAAPPMVYDRHVTYTSGQTVELQRRERPQLYADGSRLFLFSTAKTGGETRECGGKTWNMVQEFKLT